MKKNELLFNSINELSDELLTLAAPENFSSLAEPAERICEVRQEYAMKKSKNNIFIRTAAAVASVAVIAGLGVGLVVNTVKKENTLNRNDNYLVSELPEFTVTEKDLSDFFYLSDDWYYSDGKIFILTSELRSCGEITEFSLENNKAVKSFTVPEDYMYEPYNYADGTFYSFGARYFSGAERKNDPVSEIGNIRNSYCYDNKLYLIGQSLNENNYIYERNSSDDEIKAVCMDDIIEYDYEKVFFTSIAADDSEIYVGAFELAVTGGDKSYDPCIYVFDKDYKFKEKITDLNIKWPDFIVINSDGTLLTGIYDSEENVTKTNIINTADKKTGDYLEAAGNCRFFTGKDKNHMYYYDGVSVLYETDTETKESKIICDLRNIVKTDSGETVNVIDFNGSEIVFIKEDTGFRDTVFSIDVNSNIVHENCTDSFYYPMLNDDGIDYITNRSGTDKIIPEDWYSADSGIYHAAEHFYIYDNDRIGTYLSDGSKLKEIFTEGKKVYNITENDKKALIVYSEKNKFYAADITDGSIENELCISDVYPEKAYTENIKFLCGDDRYSIYSVCSGILYGTDYNRKITEPLAELSGYSYDADAVLSTENGFLVLNGNKLYDYRYGKENSSEDVPKTEITVSVSGQRQADELKPIIEKFCEQHDDISIKTEIHYLDYDDNGEEQLSLENDFISGSLADIILFWNNNSDKMDSIERTGAFCDLNKFMEADADFSDSNYLMNIIKSNEIKNKLCRMPLEFEVKTVRSRYDLISDADYGWDYEEFGRLCSDWNTYPPYCNMKKDNILSYLSLCCNNDFINYNSSEAFFDSDRFIELIKCADNNLVDPECEELDEFYYSDFMFASYGNLTTDLCRDRDADKIIRTVKGYPSDSGCYSYAEIGTTASISAASENKELCWSFVKYLLSEECSDFYSERSWFPVNRALYDRTMEVFRKQVNETSEQKLREIISGISCAYRLNSRVINILRDELLIYFSGERSAEETAEVIQNKIMLYLSETK